MVVDRKTATKNSALWAAYGDSLGFISELTDRAGLSRRLHGAELTATVQWQRQIGGKFGALVTLPKGCYSDDTQLRLSTSRCIRGDGHFDTEPFAKVELPTWLAYALGAGRGTKAAAANLSGQTVTWFSNFYGKPQASYFTSGGNGAAMRVQPHVWSARTLEDHVPILADVFRNTICTHGHVRALAGAAFHALALAEVMSSGVVPGPGDWYRFVEKLAVLEDIAHDDPEISTFWLPAWEQAGQQSFSAALKSVQDELRSDIELLGKTLLKGEPTSYAAAVDRLNGFDPSVRGSGSKTALLGLGLSWTCQDLGPKEAMLVGARLVGSDTDTNTTLAGALLGAVASSEPEDPVMDRTYLEHEAERLYGISKGQPLASFVYPDLLEWIPPKNALDCVGLCNEKPSLAGIGELQFFGEIFPARSGDSVWQWAKLGFGQSVLCKRRESIRHLHSAQCPPSASVQASVSAAELRNFRDDTNPRNGNKTNMDLFGDRHAQSRPSLSSGNERLAPRSIEDMTNEAIRSGFDPAIIGQHLLSFAERPSEIELAIAYAAIIVKARKARLKDRSRQ